MSQTKNERAFCLLNLNTNTMEGIDSRALRVCLLSASYAIAVKYQLLGAISQIALVCGMWYEITTAASHLIRRTFFRTPEAQCVRAVRQIDDLSWFIEAEPVRKAGWMIVMAQEHPGSRDYKRLTTCDVEPGFQPEAWLADVLCCSPNLITSVWRDSIMIECCAGSLKVVVIYHDDQQPEPIKNKDTKDDDDEEESDGPPPLIDESSEDECPPLIYTSSNSEPSSSSHGLRKRVHFCCNTDTTMSHGEWIKQMLDDRSKPPCNQSDCNDSQSSEDDDDNNANTDNN